MRQVARRRVFYIPGFDPFPPRRYRELFRREGRVQAKISGYALSVSARASEGKGYGWRAAITTAQATSEAEFTVLVWADLVQKSMRAGVLASYWMMLRTLWIFFSTGALLAMIRLRPAPMLSGAWPVAMLLVQAGLALGLGWVAFRLGGLVLPVWLAAVLALALAYGALVLGQRLDRRFYAYYLLYDFAHTARLRGRNSAALEARIAAFVAQIRTALSEDWDEVLVVGHSSGAALAVSVVADVLRAGLPAGAKPLSLLTLGQAIPMQSFLPQATRLRGDLRALAVSDDLFWLDVSAPGDGCCFGLTDPVAVSGVAPEGQKWPIVISAAFSKSLKPETWRKLRRRFFRLHFQYLAAFDQPRDYDYFLITAGAMRLDARFAGRKPSPGRIARPLSPHRGVQEGGA